MQSKKPRTTRGKPKAKRAKRKRVSPIAPPARLKPISLHGIEFDEVVRRLVQATARK